MTAQIQEALLVTEIGKPLILDTTRAIPQPGPSQIQVRVTVAGLNPHDQRFRDTGLLIAESLPHILAADVVGIVTGLGAAVDPSHFAIGDRVVSQALVIDSTQSGLQQYAVFDADFAAKVPEGFSDDDAAELPTNAITSYLALFGHTMLDFPAPWTRESGDASLKDVTILIIGGGSNCGRFGVQLAAAAGIGHIVVVGGDEAELKAYGANHVLNRHGSDEDVLARIKDSVGDELLYAYDTVNMPDKLHLAINALSTTQRGKIARLIPFGVPDETKIHPKKDGYQLIDVLGHPRVRIEIGKSFWAHMPQLLRERKLKPTKSVSVVALEGGLNADKVNTVLDAYRDGKRVVKTHFHISS